MHQKEKVAGICLAGIISFNIWVIESPVQSISKVNIFEPIIPVC